MNCESQQKFYLSLYYFELTSAWIFVNSIFSFELPRIITLVPLSRHELFRIRIISQLKTWIYPFAITGKSTTSVTAV
jgi:hypothetical protein